jgi:aspartate aminotransferase/aminotransferase
MNRNLLSEKMQKMDYCGGIREILAQADAMEMDGRRVIHLEIGRPDFDSPEGAKRAAIHALENGGVHYTDMAGTPELREELSAKFKRDSGMDVNPDEEIVVTSGAVEGLAAVFMTLISPGDEVVVPAPYFPVYDDQIKMAGGIVRTVPTKIENGFRPDPADMERAVTSKTKIIMINSPNNPTGATSTRAELEAIAEIAKSRDIAVLSDECYEKFSYDESTPHISIASLPGMKERTFTVSAASKTFSMTGWRVGWLVIPPGTKKFIMKSHQGMVTCSNSFAQAGVAEALRSAWPEVEKMITEYKARRDLMVGMLSEISGINVPMPRGAFYAFPDISGLGLPSVEFCARLLSETGVATVPGQPFGAPDGYMRLTYCRPRNEIKEALEKMGDFVSKLRR